jgi:hypothetical protein
MSRRTGHHARTGLQCRMYFSVTIFSASRRALLPPRISFISRSPITARDSILASARNADRLGFTACDRPLDLGAASEKHRDNVRRNSQSPAEQTGRIEKSMPDNDQQAAEVRSDLLRRNAELSRLRFELVSMWQQQRWVARPTNSGWQAVGCKMQPNKPRAAPPQCCTPPRRAAEGVSRIPQEYFALVHHQIARNVQRLNKLWGCRSPQCRATLPPQGRLWISALCSVKLVTHNGSKLIVAFRIYAGVEPLKASQRLSWSRVAASAWVTIITAALRWLCANRDKGTALLDWLNLHV